jgi:hypothetical protein
MEKKVKTKIDRVKRTVHRSIVVNEGSAGRQTTIGKRTRARMNQKEQSLYHKALKLHDRIFPCTSRSTFKECFTIAGNKLLFWYNTADHSTHILADEM